MMRHLITSLLVLFMAAAAFADNMPRHSVDHIVLGINNLVSLLKL